MCIAHKLCITTEPLTRVRRGRDAGHEGGDRADQVRERARARSSLSAAIEVKKKGRQLVARCPFHEEKTASFTVTPGKGLYHCFGCGAAGDVIGFVTKHDKVSFGGALEALARRAGPRPREAHGGAAADPAHAAGRGAHAARPARRPSSTAEGSGHMRAAAPRRAARPRGRALPPDLLRAEGRPGVPGAARPHRPRSAARAQGRLRRRLAAEADPEGRRAARAARWRSASSRPKAASFWAAASWCRSRIR